MTDNTAAETGRRAAPWISTGKLAEGPHVTDLDEHLPGRIVREKHHPATPMTVDQALHEMELVGHDFFLFQCADTGQPTVVYRRHAYDYGLIRLTDVPLNGAGPRTPPKHASETVPATSDLRTRGREGGVRRALPAVRQSPATRPKSTASPRDAVPVLQAAADDALRG